MLVTPTYSVGVIYDRLSQRCCQPLFPHTRIYYRQDHNSLAPDGELKHSLRGEVEILRLEDDGVSSRFELAQCDIADEKVSNEGRDEGLDRTSLRFAGFPQAVSRFPSNYTGVRLDRLVAG